jgi:hypothetical protein
MKKLFFIALVLFSFSANAQIATRGTPTCITPQDQDIFTAAILIGDVEIGKHMIKTDKCFVFTTNKKVRIKGSYDDMYLIEYNNYKGYVYKTHL